jgi:hypothetical protein
MEAVRRSTRTRLHGAVSQKTHLHTRRCENLKSHITELLIVVSTDTTCRFQWPRGLRRRSAAAWLLGSRVRMPLGAWMFVCCVVLCRQRGLCDGLITRPEESYRVSMCVCVIKKPRKGRPKGPSWTLRACEWMNEQIPLGYSAGQTSRHMTRQWQNWRVNKVLTTSGVLAPSVCDVESALLRAPSLPLVEPVSSGGLVDSRSSITRSMGILPFKQLMYRWQKLSHNSWTCREKNYWLWLHIMHENVPYYFWA